MVLGRNIYTMKENKYLIINRGRNTTKRGNVVGNPLDIIPSWEILSTYQNSRELKTNI